MIYLKLFENHSEYESFTGSTEFVKPNVSHCIEEKDVHYSPNIDPYNGHDYVKIGNLSWATVNIGADKVTDAGFYFQWGDTQGYSELQVDLGEKYFGWSDYKFYSSTSSENMTKYNNTDGKTVLELQDDAARANFGGLWRMPTNEEINDLINNTTQLYVTDYEGSGVKGQVLTDKTDPSKTLFFPITGFMTDGHMTPGQSGFWTSSRYGTGTNAYVAGVFPGGVILGGVSRSRGYMIRGVVSEK